MLLAFRTSPVRSPRRSNRDDPPVTDRQPGAMRAGPCDPTPRPVVATPSTAPGTQALSCDRSPGRRWCHPRRRHCPGPAPRRTAPTWSASGRSPDRRRCHQLGLGSAAHCGRGAATCRSRQEGRNAYREVFAPCGRCSGLRFQFVGHVGYGRDTHGPGRSLRTGGADRLAKSARSRWPRDGGDGAVMKLCFRRAHRTAPNHSARWPV